MNKPEKSLAQERMEVLYALHRYDVWGEDLLSDILFGNVVESVLEPRERFILEMKVDGKSDKYIRHVLNYHAPKGLSLASYCMIKSRIKKKLREGFNQELPGWIRTTDWEARRQKDAEEKAENLWRHLDEC